MTNTFPTVKYQEALEALEMAQFLLSQEMRRASPDYRDALKQHLGVVTQIWCNVMDGVYYTEAKQPAKAGGGGVG